MASVTHWGRLEPRCRTDDFAEGLRAEVRDPLWMLARQWQMGEFDADDGGSPVVAEVAYAASPIESYRARSGAAVAVDDASGPLEAMVEREPVPLDLRTRVQAGLQFARFLERRGADRVLPAFVDAFAVSRLAPADVSDDASERFVAAVAGRVVDGGALLDAALDNVRLWSLTPAGAIATADRDAVDLAADDLVDWFTRTYGAQTGGGAWNPGQLEYEFGVGLAGAPASEPTLVADDYPGGRLDWYDSDLAVAPPATLIGRADRRSLPAHAGAIPRHAVVALVGARGRPHRFRRRPPERHRPRPPAPRRVRADLRRRLVPHARSGPGGRARLGDRARRDRHVR